MQPIRKLTNPDIALALELRSEGAQWKYIAMAYGVGEKTLSRAITHVKEHGYLQAAPAVCKRVRTAQVQSRARAILASGAQALAPINQKAHSTLAGQK